MLLLFQPDSGTIAGEGTLFYPLAGAVLADLSLGGHVTATPGKLGTLRLEAVSEAPPQDDILRSTWDYLASKPRGVQTVLAAVGPSLRQPVLDRLVARGDIRRRRRKTLGLFTSTILEDGGTGSRSALISAVRQVLVDGDEPTARVAALTALISATGALPQLDREIPWTSPVIARAKELENGNWGAGAAAEAVTRTVAATVVNSVAVAVTTPPKT
ncbi:GPP34 family phosphoprotein [Mumia zhuanghuii]|nr:GPP34 family phosphoprotein [Mumia zhuanghuii]